MNEALITIASRHAGHLEKLKSGEVRKFDAHLKKLDATIRAELSKTDITKLSRAKMEAQIKAISSLLTGTMDEYHAVWRQSLIDVAVYEAGFEQRSVKNILDGVNYKLPSDTQIKAAVFSAPLANITGPSGGKLLEPYYRDLSARTVGRIEGAIRSGFARGETTSQVVRAIRGTKAAGFTDGVLSITARDARSVAQTALQHAAQQARAATWKANSDIIDRWEFVATLDSKTSTQCRSLDSTKWPLGKGPTPPIHVNCRSVTAAVFTDEFAAFNEGGLRSARDSLTGEVVRVKDQSYYTWLSKQSKGYQNSILGPTRTELLRNGGLSADRFAELNLNKNFTPATLADMRKLEPLAFEKAGL